MSVRHLAYGERGGAVVIQTPREIARSPDGRLPTIGTLSARPRLIHLEQLATLDDATFLADAGALNRRVEIEIDGPGCLP